MKTLPIVARALAFVSLAALLVGCKTTTQSEIAAAVPNDYRQRHPIAVREGKQTLTVFIGDRRGGLTASQRAEVGALGAGLAARGDRRLRHRGAVRRVERARRDGRRARDPRDPRARPACRSIRSRSGPIATEDPARLGTIRVNYPKMLAETGPCGLWPDDIGPTFDSVLHREPAALESRLRLPAQSRRAGRQPGRPGAAARRDAGARPRAARPRSTSTARASRPRPNTRMPTKARSAT